MHLWASSPEWSNELDDLDSNDGTPERMAGTVSDPRLQPARPWEQNTGAGAAPLADTKSASGRKIVLLFLGSICALTLLVIVLIYALTNAGPTGSTRSETSATAPSDYAKSNPAPLPPEVC